MAYSCGPYRNLQQLEEMGKDVSKHNQPICELPAITSRPRIFIKLSPVHRPEDAPNPARDNALIELERLFAKPSN